MKGTLMKVIGFVLAWFVVTVVLGIAGGGTNSATPFVALIVVTLLAIWARRFRRVDSTV